MHADAGNTLLGALSVGERVRRATLSAEVWAGILTCADIWVLAAMNLANLDDRVISLDLSRLRHGLDHRIETTSCFCILVRKRAGSSSGSGRDRAGSLKVLYVRLASPLPPRTCM